MTIADALLFWVGIVVIIAIASAYGIAALERKHPTHATDEDELAAKYNEGAYGRSIAERHDAERARRHSFPSEDM